MKPDGVFLSNGPGDPAAVELRASRRRASSARSKLPVFGICLGHQILGLALGGKTYKLKFGHHGANHPVMDLGTRKVEITSQNHGFAVDVESMQGRAVLVARQPQRQDRRGHAPRRAAGVQRAVPPRGVARSARRQLPVRAVPRAACKSAEATARVERPPPRD